MKGVVASLSWRWSALVKMKAFVEWFVSKLPSCAYLVLVSLSRGLHALYPLSHLFEMLVDPVLRHWPRFYWYCSNKYGVWSALPRLLFAMKGLCGSQGLTEIPWCALRMICVEQPNVRCRSESVNCMGIHDSSTMGKTAGHPTLIWGGLLQEQLPRHLINFQLVVQVFKSQVWNCMQTL